MISSPARSNPPQTLLAISFNSLHILHKFLLLQEITPCVYIAFLLGSYFRTYVLAFLTTKWREAGKHRGSMGLGSTYTMLRPVFFPFSFFFCDDFPILALPPLKQKCSLHESVSSYLQEV